MNCECGMCESAAAAGEVCHTFVLFPSSAGYNSPCLTAFILQLTLKFELRSLSDIVVEAPSVSDVWMILFCRFQEPRLTIDSTDKFEDISG